jgi:hypothetical protein
MPLQIKNAVGRVARSYFAPTNSAAWSAACREAGVVSMPGFWPCSNLDFYCGRKLSAEEVCYATVTVKVLALSLCPFAMVPQWCSGCQCFPVMQRVGGSFCSARNLKQSRSSGVPVDVFVLHPADSSGCPEAGCGEGSCGASREAGRGGRARCSTEIWNLAEKRGCLESRAGCCWYSGMGLGTPVSNSSCGQHSRLDLHCAGEHFLHWAVTGPGRAQYCYFAQGGKCACKKSTRRRGGARSGPHARPSACPVFDHTGFCTELQVQAGCECKIGCACLW